MSANPSRSEESDRPHDADPAARSDAGPSDAAALTTAGSESESTVRIATRNSPLAMWQAEFVAAQLTNHGVRNRLVPLVSSGDIDMRPMEVAAPGELRETGVFTKRIQQAVLDHEADIAVHSLKDLPTAVDDRLMIAATPPRGDVRDALVSPSRFGIDELPRGAIVGTGSKRRGAQILSRRPDLRIMPLRGNVQTRLAKLKNGDYDAIVLAEAGLARLRMDDVPRTIIPFEQMLPAPGQGALAIEIRVDDSRLQRLISKLDDFRCHAAVVAERTLLSLLDGGCLAPIAALATWQDDAMQLASAVLSVDGGTRIDHVVQSPIATIDDAVALGRAAAERMIADGAAVLLRRPD